MTGDLIAIVVAAFLVTPLAGAELEPWRSPSQRRSAPRPWSFWRCTLPGRIAPTKTPGWSLTPTVCATSSATHSPTLPLLTAAREYLL